MYDAKNRWWSMPDTSVIRSDLSGYAEKTAWTIRYLDKQQKTLGKARPRPQDLPNYRTVPTAYTELLRTRRYSENTIRTYTNLFEEFINYYHTLDPKEITEKEILAYLRYLVDERQVSISYQNQAINARHGMLSSFIMNRY